MIEVVPPPKLERHPKTPELTMLNVSVDELAVGTVLRQKLDEYALEVGMIFGLEEESWGKKSNSLHYLMYKTPDVASVQLLYDQDNLVGLCTYSVFGDLLLGPRRVSSKQHYRAKWMFGHYVMPFLYDAGMKRGLNYLVHVFSESRKNRLKFNLHHDLTHRHARWYVPPFFFTHIFEKVSDDAFQFLGGRQFASYYRLNSTAPSLTEEELKDRVLKRNG